MQHRTSARPSDLRTRVVDALGCVDRRRGGGRLRVGARPSSSGASLEERRALAEHLDDPLNRYYRYPAARGLLRIAGGLPLRPDHITYLHTTIGVARRERHRLSARRAPRWSSRSSCSRSG